MENGFREISKYRAELMGVATLAVLFTHTQVHYGTFVDRLGIMCQGGVDLFLFLSGYGIFYSYFRNPNPWRFYKKRAARVFPPFLTVLLITLIYNHRLTLKAFLLKATTLCYWHPIDGVKFFGWFVSAIVLLYALYPLYWRLFRKHPLGATLGATAIGVLLSLWYTYYYMVQHPGAHGRFILFTARIPAFYWGVWTGYLSKCRLKGNPRHLRTQLIIVAAAMLVVFYIAFPHVGWYVSRNTGLLYYPFLLIMPGLCMALAAGFQRSPAWLNKSLAVIGGASLEAYLLLGDVYSNKIRLAKALGISQNESVLLLMALTIVIAIALHWVLTGLTTMITNKKKIKHESRN